MTTPYYQDETTTLYQGDALDVLMRLPPGSVDIVVTSPPYNMGLTPGGNGRGMYPHTTQKANRFTTAGYSDAGDDAMDPEEYAALRVAELWEMHRVARIGVYWNHRPRVVHGELVDQLDSLRSFGHDLPPVRQRIILARPTGIDVNESHYCTRGEYLLLFPGPEFALVDRSASGMGDVWPTPIVPKSENKHPAPFHESVPERCIATTGASSVLDPFVGSGTTLAAAKRLGIRGVGIERSEQFCAMTAARIGSWQHSVAGSGTLWDGAG